MTVFLRFCSQEIFVRGNEFLVESDDFLSKAAKFTRMIRRKVQNTRIGVVHMCE